MLMHMDSNAENTFEKYQEVAHANKLCISRTGQTTHDNRKIRVQRHVVLQRG